MKVIVISCMHRRQKTVSECIKRMPVIDKIYIASLDEDIEFLKSQPVMAYAQYQNNPLSFKWNMAIQLLREVDFDAVILLGSDDYIDENFLKYVQNNISKYDMIGFSDIYFQEDGQLYYWRGYENHRKGEPCGAGKVYSREFLEKINFNLFPMSRNRSLDGMSWNIVKSNTTKIHITSIKEHGLILVDIKDGEGLTSLSQFNHLVKVRTAPHNKINDVKSI